MHGAHGEQIQHWAAHWANDGKTCGHGNDAHEGNYSTPLPANSTHLYNETYHVFGANIDREQDRVIYYVDDKQVGEVDGWSKKVNEQHDWFFILNLAVGGGFPGKPANDTVFPQYMVCDWVRHYVPVGGGGGGDAGGVWGGRGRG